MDSITTDLMFFNKFFESRVYMGFEQMVKGQRFERFLLLFRYDALMIRTDESGQVCFSPALIASFPQTFSHMCETIQR